MKIITLLIAMFFSGSLMAQTDSSIINTSWKGIMYMPSTTDVVLSFSKDTLKLIVDNDVLEVMTYQIKKDMLHITKVEGFSPCDKSSIWICSFNIKANELYLNSISDDCTPRFESIDENAKFTRYIIKEN